MDPRKLKYTHPQHIVHERTSSWSKFQEANLTTAASIHPLREEPYAQKLMAMLYGCYHGCPSGICMTPYLAEHLADFGACDEVAAGAYDRLRRLHVVSRGRMSETHLHVRCKGYWPCCLQTSSASLY